MPEVITAALDSPGPSALGLTRLSGRLSFPPGGEALYRAILRLVDLPAEAEFLLLPCGRGRSALFLAESTGAAGSGADPDPRMVAAANERAKRADRGDTLHFDEAPLDDLPYQDAVFDLVVTELALGAAEDPAAALREVVRVVKPGGSVALIQLVWVRPPEGGRERDLVERLGVRPRMPIRWKQLLTEAGVEDLHVEDWSDSAAPESQPSVLGGIRELFTLSGRIRLLPRAWERWGWRGVRALFSREQELRHLIEGERGLGVSLMVGRRAGTSDTEEDGEEHDE